MRPFKTIELSEIICRETMNRTTMTSGKQPDTRAHGVPGGEEGEEGQEVPEDTGAENIQDFELEKTL